VPAAGAAPAKRWRDRDSVLQCAPDSGGEQMTGKAVEARQWWRSLGSRAGLARGDIAGGVTAALVLPAIEGSYGLLAFGPMGADHAQLGFLLGACTAAVASIVTAALGGRGPLLSGSSGALAVLMAALITTLVADPRFLGADGQPFLPLVLAYVAVGVVLAGVLQSILAALKLGGLVYFVPFPVHAGYINGSALLMVGAMVPHVLGVTVAYGGPTDWQDYSILAPLVALSALLIALRPPAWTRGFPPYLLGLLVASGLHHLLALTPLAGGLGPLLSAPVFEWPRADTLAPALERLGDGLLLDNWWPLLQFAVAVAMMSTLQTALAGSSIDEITRQRRYSERELFAQGVANVAVGVFGAPPASASTTRSKLNLDAGGSTAVSRLVFGVSLLVALALGLRLMNYLPMAAIAGVFIAVAVGLLDKWTRGGAAVLWRQTLKRRVPRSLAWNYATMVAVAAITVFVSLAAAILLGTLAAMVMFIRSNSKRPIRQVVHAGQRTSRKIRPAAEAELLRANGSRIVLVELDGALFFGTAEAADEEIEHLAHGVDYLILDFERVTEVDASGARVLLLTADFVQSHGRQLLLSGLMPNDPRTRSIRDMDVHGLLADAQFFHDADRALEHAEDRLLDSLAPSKAQRPVLGLKETLLGSGLDAGELAQLSALMVERRLARGEAVFRRGDPGDAMYVSLQGRIGIWLPPGAEAGEAGRGRRMVSYAPGVAFGEMGLLQGRPRSADAIAEEDALVLELPRAGYERIAADSPALLAKMLLNLGLLLSSRVRALTDELEALQGSR
jgi:SulP family sulfate permease